MIPNGAAVAVSLMLSAVAVPALRHVEPVRSSGPAGFAEVTRVVEGARVAAVPQRVKPRAPDGATLAIVVNCPDGRSTSGKTGEDARASLRSASSKRRAASSNREPGGPAPNAPGRSRPQDSQEPPHTAEGEGEALVITVRPWTLAAFADELAGQAVRLPRARVVRVFDPRVFLVESHTPLRPMLERNRILVFIETGTLRADAMPLVDATVTITGVARTLRGMQVGREVPWPPPLTRDAIERLDIEAAVLAQSVRTPEGIELLASPSQP